MSGEGTADRLAADHLGRADEMLAEARTLRARAEGLESQADAVLRNLVSCPSCTRRGAPYCTSLDCGCSESCHDRWHTVKGHRSRWDS